MLFGEVGHALHDFSKCLIDDLNRRFFEIGLDVAHKKDHCLESSKKSIKAKDQWFRDLVNRLNQKTFSEIALSVLLWVKDGDEYFTVAYLSQRMDELK